MDEPSGGQAVIFHHNLNIASVPLPFVPSRFDAQIVRLIAGSERFLLINIYRPPRYIEAAFFDELSEIGRAHV